MLDGKWEGKKTQIINKKPVFEKHLFLLNHVKKSMET